VEEKGEEEPKEEKQEGGRERERVSVGRRDKE
jgi:hypothetical protein